MLSCSEALCVEAAPCTVVNLFSNTLVKLLGKVENSERFLSLALYQVPSLQSTSHHHEVSSWYNGQDSKGKTQESAAAVTSQEEMVRCMTSRA